MSPGAMLAAVVEQPLTDCLPCDVAAVEPQGVGARNLDHSEAAQAFDA